MKRISGIIFIVILIFCGILYGKTKSSSVDVKAATVDQIVWIPNKMAASLLNDGRLFHDVIHTLNPVSDNEAGLFWPYPTMNAYIFGSGVWVGCVDGKDTLVTVGYNPNSGQSEFSSGIGSMVGTTDPDNRIYDYPDDWPPPESKFPMAPQENFSPNDIWLCFNDVDSTLHASGDTRPIGIEVYVTGYGWTQASNQDILFLKYTIKNISGDSLKDVYMSVTVDPDIGYYRDDMIGLIVDRDYTINNEEYHVDNVGVCYDYDGEEKSSNSGYKWESGEPGCIAFDFLQSPYALTDGIDNDGDGLVDAEEVDSVLLAAKYDFGDRDGDGVPDYRDPSEIEQLGMTAFKKFIIELDPDKDWKRYLLMAGFDMTGVRNPYDSVDVSPGDKRFLQATGPFVLAPESTATIVVAVIAAPFGGEGGFNNRNHDTLAMRSATAQYIFNMNWLLPAPPPSPNLTVIPGDNIVLLTWDDSPENFVDPYYALASDPTSAAYDPNYVKYDFQGYRVWRSLDGTEWKLLGTFDKMDGITVDDSILGIKAGDYGLTHSFIDDDSVVNGYTYYYSVTSFDYNYNTIRIDTSTTEIKPFTLESGRKAYSVVPRSDPANITTPLDKLEFGTPLYNSGDSLRSPLVITPRIMDPDKLEGDTLNIEFKGVEYGGLMTAIYPFDISCKGSVIYSGELRHDVGSKSEALLSLSDIGVELSIKDTMDVTSLSLYPVSSFGTYPEEKLTLSSIKGYQWPTRGSDIKIVWYNDGGNWTVSVHDVTFDKEIPYSPFTKDEEGAKYGNGWCFYAGNSASRNLIVDETKGLFVSGILILLNRGKVVSTEEIAFLKEGEEWNLSGTKLVAPLYSNIDIAMPLYDITDTMQTLNVKVVPNPYIVTNTWEKDTYYRQIAFYDLPDECTIRIYNIAGDLVKTIEHISDNKGIEFWNLLNESGQIVASGVYLFSVDSRVGKYVGKIFIVH